MREERVILSKIDVDRLVTSTKDHLQELGLKIIYEDTFEGCHSIKAYKGGIPSLVTGSVRDVEILITGKDKDYEVNAKNWSVGQRYCDSITSHKRIIVWCRSSCSRC